jgi:hypothetical protein
MSASFIRTTIKTTPQLKNDRSMIGDPITYIEQFKKRFKAPRKYSGGDGI